MQRFSLGTLLIFSIFVCSSVSLAADNELTPEEKAAGWTLLFNGENHDDLHRL